MALNAKTQDATVADTSIVADIPQVQADAGLLIPEVAAAAPYVPPVAVQAAPAYVPPVEAVQQAAVVEHVVAEYGHQEIATTVVEQPTTGQDLAVAGQGGGLAVVVAPVKRNFVSEMAQEGFEGMELDFHSFITVSMNDRKFNVSRGPDFKEQDEVFHILMQESKQKLQWSARAFDPVKRTYDVKDTSTDIIFVYPRQIGPGVTERMDTMVTTKGQPLLQALAELKSRGFTDDDIQMKTYLEVQGVIDEPGHESDGELCALSIPPTSSGILSGLVRKLINKNRWKPNEIREGLSKVRIQVSVGDQNVKAKVPYSPWEFKAIEQATYQHITTDKGTDRVRIS